MSFSAFRLLSPVAQLRWVLEHGAFLAQRFEQEGGVNLYYCADEGRGFFAEVGIDEAEERFVVLRSFRSAVPLADYVHGVRLPEW